MSLFPIFMKLAGRPALVVGGGELAAGKIDTLLAARAAVTVVSPRLSPKARDAQRGGRFDWVRREFQAGDIRGKTIVFAATGASAVDRAVFAACSDAGVLCNAIDDPEFCDFYAPAIVRRGDLQIAISTNGQSPALAQQIRQELEARFDPSWEKRIAELGCHRRAILASLPSREERVQVLHAQARAESRKARGGLLGRAAVVVQKWLESEDDGVPLI